MPLTSKPPSTWFRWELYIAIAVLLWVRYFASPIVRDLVSYALLSLAICVVSYYCLQVLSVRIKDPSLHREALVVAYAKSPVWFYIGAFGVAAALVLDGIFLYTFISETNQSPQLWLGLAFGFFALGLLYAWLGGYRLRLFTSLIEYQSLFGGFRALRLNDIQHARIRIGWFTYWDRFRPTIRLEILPGNGAHKKPVVVNMKVFRKEDLDRVLNWLGPKLDEHDRTM